MADKWAHRGAKAVEAIKQGAEVAANTVHRATAVLASTESQVASGVETATQFVGSGLDSAARSLAEASKHASEDLHRNANRYAAAVEAVIAGPDRNGGFRNLLGRVGGTLAKLVTHGGGMAATAMEKASQIAAATGRITERGAPALGGAAGGVVRGAAEFTSNAVDSTMLPASSIEEMRRELQSLGEVERGRSEKRLLEIHEANSAGRRDELLDLLAVGHFVLSQAIINPVSLPAEVQKAFECAYPGLAQHETFAEVVSRMSGDELVGLASGVKGKLFELALVDHLNHGGLPEGFHAELARSAAQPGWDIQVLDANGHVSELLQAKATDSVAYVREAFDRYPGIDVATTSEVHAHLVALGLAEHASSNGISDAALQAKIDAAMHAGSATVGVSDFIPSSVGLAVIALSVFMNRQTNLREKGAAFGQRSAKAGVSGVAGKAAMVMTQSWWFGLLAGVGSRWLAGHGGKKRNEYEVLASALAIMRRKHLGTPPPGMTEA